MYKNLHQLNKRQDSVVLNAHQDEKQPSSIESSGNSILVLSLANDEKLPDMQSLYNKLSDIVSRLAEQLSARGSQSSSSSVAYNVLAVKAQRSTTIVSHVSTSQGVDARTSSADRLSSAMLWT